MSERRVFALQSGKRVLDVAERGRGLPCRDGESLEVVSQVGVLLYDDPVLDVGCYREPDDGLVSGERFGVPTRRRSAAVRIAMRWGSVSWCGRC